MTRAVTEADAEAIYELLFAARDEIPLSKIETDPKEDWLNCIRLSVPHPTRTENHRRRMRTSNPMERAVQQEIKRRTQKVRVFPNEASLIRLVSAVLVEIDDNWVAETAAGAYQLRRRREAILEKDQKLRTFVCDRLAEG